MMKTSFLSLTFVFNTLLLLFSNLYAADDHATGQMLISSINSRTAGQNHVYTMNDIIKAYTDNSIPIEKLFKEYSPSRILQNIAVELKGMEKKSLRSPRGQDLYAQWFWAARFHLIMTSEFMENEDVFAAFLRISGVKLEKNQNDLLQESFPRISSALVTLEPLTKFFFATSPLTKRQERANELILGNNKLGIMSNITVDNILPSLQKRLQLAPIPGTTSLLIQPQYAQDFDILLQAIRFGSENAIIFGLNLAYTDQDPEKSTKLFDLILDTLTPQKVNDIAIKLSQVNMETAKKLFIHAANQGLTPAMRNLATLYAYEGNLEETAHWLKRAKDNKDYDALLLLADTLAAAGQRDQAKKYYEDAISYGIKEALHNYLKFLLTAETLNFAETIEFLMRTGHIIRMEAYEVQIGDQAESTSSIALPQAVISLPPQPQAAPSQATSEKPTPPKEKSKTPTIPPKRLQRSYDRPADTATSHVGSSNGFIHSMQQVSEIRTYHEVEVFVTHEVQKEIDSHELFIKRKIQGLISMLANGETTRANFEMIKIGKNITYSMRTTDGDRLNFLINKRDELQRVTSINILSTTTHHKHLDRKAGKTCKVTLIDWGD